MRLLNMKRLRVLSLVLSAQLCRAVDYAIPYNADYSYVVIVAKQQPTGVFLAERRNGELRKIPQTVRLNDGSFSILCDLKFGDRKGGVGYALVNLKGAIKVSKNGVRKIGSKAGKRLKPPGK